MKTQLIPFTLATLASLLLASMAMAQPGPAMPAAPEGGLLFTSPPSANLPQAGPTIGSQAFGQPAAPTGLSLENSAFMYQPLSPEAESRQLRKEDIITVLVDYRSTMQSEGEAQSRKTSNYNAVLSDWLGFDGKSIFAAPQSRGDPRVSGAINSQTRAEGEIELRDALTFRIAAKIVDIRPNGNLVIEAHRDIHVNDEVWRTSLTGIVRRQAIQPDRTVRSDSIADLKIHKKEIGQVRNAYAPGWFSFWWGKAKPF